MSGEKTDPTELFAFSLESPLGMLHAVTDADGVLRALEYGDHRARLERLLKSQYGPRCSLQGRPPEVLVAQALEAYFAGDLAAIGALPWTTAGTPFQRRVWRALTEIPPGETTSYGALAERLGQPTATRAVGLANGANPIAIVVPCHRVIGADGALTGYGGGLARKRWLLEHEGGWRAEPETGDLFE